MSDQNNTPATDKKPLRAVRTRTSGRGIADRVREIITPTANELGYYLWDVEYVKEGADFVLRVTIDNDEGMFPRLPSWCKRKPRSGFAPGSAQENPAR